MLDQVTFRKIATFAHNSRYAFESNQKNNDGIPLYEYYYLGNEKNMFVVIFEGEVIAQIKNEVDVRDFIQGHYVGVQYLAEGLAL